MPSLGRQQLFDIRNTDYRRVMAEKRTRRPRMNILTLRQSSISTRLRGSVNTGVPQLVRHGQDVLKGLVAIETPFYSSCAGVYRLTRKNATFCTVMQISQCVSDQGVPAPQFPHGGGGYRPLADLRSKCWYGP